LACRPITPADRARLRGRDELEEYDDGLDAYSHVDRHVDVSHADSGRASVGRHTLVAPGHLEQGMSARLRGA
jgi:hypothetical protein